MAHRKLGEVDEVLAVQVHVRVEEDELERVAGAEAEQVVQAECVPVVEEQPAVGRQLGGPSVDRPLGVVGRRRVAERVFGQIPVTEHIDRPQR